MKMRIAQFLLSVVMMCYASWEHNWHAVVAWFIVMLTEIQLALVEVRDDLREATRGEGR